MLDCVRSSFALVYSFSEKWEISDYGELMVAGFLASLFLVLTVYSKNIYCNLTEKEVSPTKKPANDFKHVHDQSSCVSS